jgi:hypothetical protein
VTGLVGGADLADLVLGFQRTAFRLETRDEYHEQEEEEPFRRFLAGEPDYSWNDEWARLIAQRSAEGDSTVGVLRFRSDGRLDGAEIHAEPTVVAEHTEAERKAWAQAVSVLDFRP